jgi:hypothetical protein
MCVKFKTKNVDSDMLLFVDADIRFNQAQRSYRIIDIVEYGVTEYISWILVSTYIKRTVQKLALFQLVHS